MEKFGEIKKINEINLINSLKIFRMLKKYIRIISYKNFPTFIVLENLKKLIFLCYHYYIF